MNCILSGKIMGKLFLVLFSLFFLSCREPSDIEIGFVADFSSGQSELGLKCRNAAQMAVNDINAAGGVKGRKLVLLSRDNGDDGSAHESIIDEFQERGVRLIIGPILSRMAPSLIEAAAGKDMLIFSPVVSSDHFAGIDDNFFRIQPLASTDGVKIGEAMHGRGDRTAVLIRDLGNDLYTDSFMEGVRSVLEEKEIEILLDLAFTDRDDLKRITSRVMELNPDALVLSALGIDAGTIIQQIGKSGALPHLYGDEWSRTTDVILYAGKYGENMISTGIFNSHEDKNLEMSLRQRYVETYREEPVFFVYYTYEVLMILALALEETGVDSSSGELKDFVLHMENFEGILGHLMFDAYGDSLREKRLYIIHNQEYEPY